MDPRPNLINLPAATCSVSGMNFRCSEPATHRLIDSMGDIPPADVCAYHAHRFTRTTRGYRHNPRLSAIVR
jgi:hypothetical protein